MSVNKKFLEFRLRLNRGFFLECWKTSTSALVVKNGRIETKKIFQIDQLNKRYIGFLVPVVDYRLIESLLSSDLNSNSVQHSLICTFEVLS